MDNIEDSMTPFVKKILRNIFYGMIISWSESKKFENGRRSI